MPGLIIFALALVVVFVIILIKQSADEKQGTDQSFDEQEIKRAGTHGEIVFRHKIRDVLDSNDVLLNNVEVEVEDEDLRTEIDSLIINKNGIFIVEVKNYNGKLYGDADDREWDKYKITPGGQVFSKTVRNPFKQINRNIYILSKYLRENNLKIWIKGYVYFVNDNSPVEDERVIRDEYELEEIIHQNQGKTYDEKTIQKAISLLEQNQLNL